MIRFTGYALGLVFFFGSFSAFAASEDPKLKLGLRLGYALAQGDFVKDYKMSKLVTGQVPIWVDAGYQVTPHVLVGLYGQYGILRTVDLCTDCSGRDLRFGAQAQYHVLPAAAVDPWFGLSSGYEILTLSDGGQDDTLRGVEFLNLQGGADFRVAQALSVGPFLSASLAEYSHDSYASHDDVIQDKALHTWLTLGAKGTFGL